MEASVIYPTGEIKSNKDSSRLYTDLSTDFPADFDLGFDPGFLSCYFKTV